ncbi:hypothetical protein [Bacteroides sp. 224]|nr:hypothetical protein [Bacteroides sp. 224]
MATKVDKKVKKVALFGYFQFFEEKNERFFMRISGKSVFLPHHY